jgi:hypothetical protein
MTGKLEESVICDGPIRVTIPLRYEMTNETWC